MISAETIALVKERTDIVALIGETVRLVRRGRSFTGLCPFHKEKTPSFHVNAERGFFHCFGCKESGGAVDFVMKTEGSTFPEAIRSLADRAGIAVEETATDQEKREAQAARRAKDDLYAVNQLAATFYEHCLRGGPMAPKGHAHPLARYGVDELRKRGIEIPAEGIGGAADALQAFRIGYAPYAWDGLATFFKQQGISPAVGERVGLLISRAQGGGHYDRFRHRLMFAVTDVMGRVIAFSGRALPEPDAGELADLGLAADKRSDDHTPAKYMNSPESPIYTKGEHLFGLHQARHAIRQSGEAVLVEGNFDVFSLHARGVGNVVAPLGTAFTEAQAKLLKRFAPTVTILFDGDAAGRKATRAARVPCREGGLEAKVATLPSGVDPDELVRKQGVAGLQAVLKASKGFLEVLIADALDPEGFSSSTMSERKARINHVLELLREETDPNLRGMAKTFADELSKKLIVGNRAAESLATLTATLDATLSRIPAPPLRASETAAAPARARSNAREDDLGLAILGALLDFPDLIFEPETMEGLEVLTGDVALAAVALRQVVSKAYFKAPGPDGASANRAQHSRLYFDEFLAKPLGSIHPFALQRLASPLHGEIEDARSVVRENVQRLLSLSLKRENASVITERLQKAEAQGDHAATDEYLREVVRTRMKRGLG